MGKQKKELGTLYCGTTERIAKLAPVHGLNPQHKPVYLTDVYPGLLAFYASTNDEERFGIVEVDLTHLDPTNFLPCEWYLEATSRQKKAKSSREHHRQLEAFRKNLDKYQAKWKDSLQRMGICVYDGFISKKCIRRITIYDPTSNQTITDAIVGSTIGLTPYRKSHDFYRAVTRWLVGRESRWKTGLARQRCSKSPRKKGRSWRKACRTSWAWTSSTWKLRRRDLEPVHLSHASQRNDSETTDFTDHTD